jgi:hypothetical protein
VAGLKRWIRDLDLWCSSCMIARDDTGDLVGVLLGCKRAAETFVLALGVHPDHLQRGHGRHLLASLSSKLAILGPPRVVAEVPADDARACAFFESCGYVAEARLQDFTLDPAAVPPRLVPELVQPVTVDELLAAAAGTARPWARAPEALRRRHDLQGLAIPSPDRLEAWLLWRGEEGGCEVLGLGAAPGSEALLSRLLGHVAAQCPDGLALPRLTAEELPGAARRALGLRAGREYVRYAAAAAPA